MSNNINRDHIIFLGLGLIVTFLASAIKSIYQVYFPDLAKNYNVNFSDISMVGAIFGLAVGILSPITGSICDKYGATKTIFSGIIIAIIAFLLISFSKSYFILVLSYSIFLAYSLTTMTFVPFGILVDSIFQEEQKGLMYTILSNGTSIGFIVLSPLWIYINKSITWYDLCFYLFFTYLILLVPTGVILNKNYKITPSKSTSQSTTNISEIFKPKFLLLALSFGGCGAAMAFIDVHLVSLLKNINIFQEQFLGSRERFIALSLSTLGITELIGAFLIVFILRFLNPFILLALLYGLRSIIFYGIKVSTSAWISLILIASFGLTYMGTVIISSLICLKWYGIEIKGKMFGVMFLFHQLFVFLSVWLGGMIFDKYASYDLYIYFLIGLSFLSSISAIVLFFSSIKNLNMHKLNGRTQ